MKQPALSIEVASVPDRDELVAELWMGDRQVAELSQDGGKQLLQLYPPADGKWWEFELDEFVSRLGEMKQRLNG
jgi:hypothetical protein